VPLITLARHVQHTPPLQAYGKSAPACRAASSILSPACASIISNVLSSNFTLTFLKKYIEVRQHQFNFPFKYAIITDCQTYTEQQIIVSTLLVQPLVENAINFAFHNKPNNTDALAIYFIVADKNKLQIKIQDSGTGYDLQNILQQKNLRSINIINERLKIKNNSTSDQLVATTTSEGFELCFYFPLVIDEKSNA
jgi:LytS/YehU family sensor histidine kinase